MGIKLDKKTGINLKKGSSISLEKKGTPLEKVCIGLNWGMIKTKMLFGLVSSSDSVDLDGSVSLFDEGGNELDMVYFRKLRSDDGAITHSGDDRSGDVGGDDGLDNEIIEINLKRVSPRATKIFFYLNSYKKQDFADIPYSKIRIFEGDKRHVSEVLATFNLSAEPAYAGHVSMIMGMLERTDAGWKFHSIGEPIAAEDIDATVSHIQSKYFA